MTKVKLMKGIESMSGTLAKNAHGDRVIAKTFTKANGTKETRLYFYKAGEGVRTTPVSDKEKAQRARFAQANEALKQLTPEQKQHFAQQCHDSHFFFNGKQYRTFRGYLLARLMLDL